MLSSFLVDFEARRRLGGLTLNYFILSELALPRLGELQPLVDTLALRLSASHPLFADQWLGIAVNRDVPLKTLWAITDCARRSVLGVLDAMCLVAANVTDNLASSLLFGDVPEADRPASDPKGFWRVDKDLEPQLRQPVIAAAALRDMQDLDRIPGGKLAKTLQQLVESDRGLGWKPPNTVRVSDFDRAVTLKDGEGEALYARLGPRLLDWQVAQLAEESWCECELHARNLGSAYASVTLADMRGEGRPSNGAPSKSQLERPQHDLFS